MIGSIFQRWRTSRRLRKRLIFSFFDGQQTRWADPLRLLRSIFQHPTADFSELVKFYHEGHEPEATRFIEGLCDVFGVQRFDGRTATGLTDEEIVSLWDQLAEWFDVQKKTRSLGPTLPAPTASGPTAGPAAPAEATPLSADCGRSLTAASCERDTAPPAPSSVSTAPMPMTTTPEQ